MKYKYALDILNRFYNRRVIVLGDLMLDEFIWGEVQRISPESPVPVVEVRRESWHLGGAGNVASNLLALGSRAISIGVIGDDEAGQLLRSMLTDSGALTDGLIVDSSRPTTRKTRIVAHNQQMVRTDRECRSPISREIEEKILSAFNFSLAETDAVIISDYDKGLLTPHVLESVINATHAQHKIICLDPKIKNFLSYRHVDVITPNQSEAERASGIEIVNDASFLTAASRIREMLDCQNVLITRGEHGMSLLSEETVTHIPTMAREVYDVTGAGDTVIAALTLAIAAGANVIEAATIANHAASVVVGKVGTATVSLSELATALVDMETNQRELAAFHN